MARRYFLSPIPPSGRVELPAELVRHLRSVRARAGESIRLFDGAGLEAEARITEVGRGSTHAEIGPLQTVHREAPRPVEIACALPKGGRADWLFEHATELGVTAFHPIRTARSARANAREGSLDRWQRIVRAAAGQCDRSHLPTIHPERELAEFLGTELPRERWIAAPGGDDRPGTGSAPAILLVGPEGGFTDDELRLAAEAGFRTASLGPLILRAETAALVGAARLLG